VPGAAGRGLTDAVRAATGRAVQDIDRISGGDINEAYKVTLEGGAKAFVKTRAGAARSEYATEAEGLAWLGEAGGLPVPDVLGVSDALLALEWVEPGRRGDEAQLGRGLALTHAAGAHAFGGPRPLRIGPLELPNDPAPDWATFYAERRLRPLLHAVPDSTALTIERVCERLGEFDPGEPPARLHGDLWTGNVHWGADGRPWLIDPAAYGGSREVDIAMLKLFGSPGAAFLDAYEEIAPLADGHAERAGLWQLFPLLVHAALFGGGYASSAEQTARRYL
jgi:fructosamine-3-kinase